MKLLIMFLSIGSVLLGSGCASLRPSSPEEIAYNEERQCKSAPDESLGPFWGFLNFFGGFWPHSYTVNTGK